MSERAVEPLSAVSRWHVLLPGLYAWAITIAAPAAARSNVAVRLSAALALAVLLAAPLFAPRRPAIAHALGVYGFVAASILCWALLVREGALLGAEPLRTALGAVGWMAYAFAWGELRRARVPEDDPGVIAGPPLAARGGLGRSAEVIFGVGVAGTLLIWLLPFRIVRPAHALMGHALAVLISLSLVGGATRVALERGPRALPAPNERMSAAATLIAALVIVLGLGALWTLLGR